MNFSIDSLFKKENPVETKPTNVSEQPVSPNDRRRGETYYNWGIRMCATVMGSNYALSPYLQKVYSDIYNDQAKNVELQEQFRKNTQAQIDEHNNNIESLKTQISNSTKKLNENKENIEEFERQRSELKTRGSAINKDARIKMVLGIIILIPLTFYLFLFYSSTFYTGFIMDTEDVTGMTGVAMAMFNPQAFTGALAKGLTSFFLILSFPVVFLGLGFGLHFFSVQQSKSRFLKMGSILLVTFLFDCIIAYKIGKFLYDIEGMWKEQSDVYSFNMAIGDINTWAVIFCGFIAYIIWGIVFDMAMSAYSKLDLNKEEIKVIDNKIQMIKDENAVINEQISNCNNQITSLKNAIGGLMSKLSNHININLNAIKQEMTNFFNGWITQMGVLGCNQQEQSMANATFQNTLNTLIDNKNN